MEHKLQFQEKLKGILELAQKNQNRISLGEVEAYFGEGMLNEEQIGLVCEYLLSQKIAVKGYAPRGGSVRQSAKEEQKQFRQEDVQYLTEYEAEIMQLSQTDPKMAGYLKEVLALAKELHTGEVFLEDLVQEGNISLVMSLQDVEKSDEEVLKEVRAGIEALLAEQAEVRRTDQRMVEKVCDLDRRVKELTEDLGHKVTIDELAIHLEMTEEEIEDILKLAGEDITTENEEE